jgi:hypothetical protein
MEGVFFLLVNDTHTLSDAQQPEAFLAVFSPVSDLR